MPMVSVIVPCYNAAKTLPATVLSLHEQTFQDFEVILIDDGSTDETAEMVQKIRETTSLPVVSVRQENAGVSAARNRGIESAGGKYICFLDADDIYHRHFLERTVHVCEALQADTVLTYQDRDLERLRKDTGADSSVPEVLDRDAFMEHFMYNKENIHFGGLIYKKEIIDSEEIRFTVGAKYGEDLEFAWKYMTHCGNGVILKEKMYGYYCNPTSAVNTVCWEYTNLVDAMLRVENYMKAKNCTFTEEFSGYFLPRTVWTTAKTFAKGKRMDYYTRFVQEYRARDYIRQLIKSSRNLLLKMSSVLFCVSRYAFYGAIRIVYRNR